MKTSIIGSNQRRISGLLTFLFLVTVYMNGVFARAEPLPLSNKQSDETTRTGKNSVKDTNTESEKSVSSEQTREFGKGKKDVTHKLLRYILPDDCNDEDKEANAIAAEEVVEAIKDGKVVEIINAVIEGTLMLKSVIVEGEVTIEWTKVKGSVDCSYATFRQVLSLKHSTFETDVNFTAAIVDKDIFLKEAAFLGAANFFDLTVEGVFYSNSTTFTEVAFFNSTTFKKGILFRGSIFKGGADFISARIGGDAVFVEGTFKHRAIFNGAQIEGGAFFDQATFVGEADFGLARIGENAEFTEGTFEQRAIFNSAHIEENTFFNSATFKGEANFVGARIGNAEFTEAVFAGNVNFMSTSFRTVIFGEHEQQTKFQGNVNLRGCVYDRIDPISFWKKLVERLDPYDRQPFTQLEETFRRAGNDRLANDVYYEGRCRKPDQIKVRNFASWFPDRFLWLLTGYGVRLRRLGVLIAILLMLTTFIFHLEGAVESKQDKQPPPAVSSQVSPEAGSPLSLGESFMFGLNRFLPVEIPSGADWKPSNRYIVRFIRFATFATVLKVAGWFFVPLLVTGLYGVLKR